MQEVRNILSYAPVKRRRRNTEHFTLQIVAWMVFILVSLVIFVYLLISTAPRR